MSKKSIDRKEIISQVLLAEQEGRTRQELFDELKEKYYDEKKIAMQIASVPKTELKKKYNYLNTTLMVLLGFSGLSKMLLGIELLSEFSSLSMLFIPLLAIFDIFLIIGISKFQATIYNLAALFALMGLVNTTKNLDSAEPIWSLALLLFPIAVGIIALSVKARVFPHLPFNGLVEKMPNGDYKLGD